MSTSFRRNVERKAGPVIVVLARLPKIVPFLIVMGLLVPGLLIQGTAGAVLLGALSLLLAVLLFLAWPALQPPARALRLLVVVAVAVQAAFFLV